MSICRRLLAASGGLRRAAVLAQSSCASSRALLTDSSSTPSPFNSSPSKSTSTSPFNSTYSPIPDVPAYKEVPPTRQLILYALATRNNITITITNENGPMRADNTRAPATLPKRAVFTAGMVGFTNAQRSGYEAGYRTAIEAFKRVLEDTADNGPAKLHICLSGFGQARDAVTRTLFSPDWIEVRNMVNRITDRTPIKIGGTRAKKKRTL